MQPENKQKSSFEKLRKKALRHEVYDRLLDAILSGELPQGSHMDEQELADKFGISRTPIREAVNRLIHEGVIIEMPFKGNFVRTFTAEEVNEIYEIRKTLEVMAIKLAVVNMTDEEIREIEELVNKISDALDQDNITEFTNRDTLFHTKIAEYSRNQTLIRMLQSLDLQIRLIKRIANNNTHVVNRTQFERVQILKALRNRNQKLAAKFMEEHIENVRIDVIETLNKKYIT